MYFVFYNTNQRHEQDLFKHWQKSFFLSSFFLMGTTEAKKKSPTLYTVPMVLNPHGIEPTLLKLDSYYNLQNLDQGKERKKLRKKTVLCIQKKHLMQFLKMGSIPCLVQFHAYRCTRLLMKQTVSTFEKLNGVKHLLKYCYSFALNPV